MGSAYSTSVSEVQDGITDLCPTATPNPRHTAGTVLNDYFLTLLVSGTCTRGSRLSGLVTASATGGIGPTEAALYHSIAAILTTNLIPYEQRIHVNSLSRKFGITHVQTNSAAAVHCQCAPLARTCPLTQYSHEQSAEVFHLLREPSAAICVRVATLACACIVSQFEWGDRTPAAVSLSRR